VSVRLATFCVISFLAAVLASPSTAAIPTTGEVRPELAALDDAVTAMLERYAIPGAALAVVHEGRLVYARGYGYADRSTGTLVEPDSRFRIASISKPITAAAVLTLVDSGKLSLNTKVFDLLGDLKPVPGAILDPGLESIPVRLLLQHQGGWDRDTTFDPMFRAREAAAAVGAASPGDCTTIIRWMLGFPLQFTPGTKRVYSNFGYCVLGRVIEHASARPYATYVRQAVLAPLAMAGTALGHTLQPLPGEVRYYDIPNAGVGTSVFDGISQVPWQYGGYYLEAMDSHGGWVSTPADLLRLLTGLNETRGKLLTKTYSWSYRPIPPQWSPGFAGSWAHEGALVGASGIAAVTGENGWALLTNTWRPDTDFVQSDPLFWDVRAALDSITSWPSGDLFTSDLGRRYGHELTVSLTGAGTVASVPASVACPPSCSVRLPAGTTMDLSARPDGPLDGFVSWSGACSGAKACRVTLDGDVSVSATFVTRPGHTLTVTKAGSGLGQVTSSPSGIDCGTTCTTAVAQGTAVTLTATAAPGSKFVGWSNGCAGSGVCAVTMDADRSPVATFRVQCVVPRIVRKTLTAARSALQHAGCSLGRARHVFSSRIPKGRVVSQHPYAGNILPGGSSVHVALSKGRKKQQPRT
jgi:CubicO group peptidase (beta-lactamase class C family)